jgi:hypothetical protein
LNPRRLGNEPFGGDGDDGPPFKTNGASAVRISDLNQKSPFQLTVDFFPQARSKGRRVAGSFDRPFAWCHDLAERTVRRQASWRDMPTNLF